MSERGLVVLDVDGCISDGRPASRCEFRPSILLLVDTLTLLGFEVVAWSAGGEEHARSVVEAGGLHGAILRCFGKPDYPMTATAAIQTLGGRPVLQIDDDHTERIGDWPFMLWQTFHRPGTILAETQPFPLWLRRKSE